MSEEEAKKGIGGAIKETLGTVYDKTGLHKAMDATVFDKSPHGTNVDGFVDTKGVTKEVIDHTVLDTTPTNVDGFVPNKVSDALPK